MVLDIIVQRQPSVKYGCKLTFLSQFKPKEPEANRDWNQNNSKAAQERASPLNTDIVEQLS
jgi:hypothetical protein